jgi:hypothetical protein
MKRALRAHNAGAVLKNAPTINTDHLITGTMSGKEIIIMLRHYEANL